MLRCANYWDSRFGKNLISPENRSAIEQIQNQALENQDAFYQMHNQHKASQTENPEPPPAPPKNRDIEK